MKKHNIPQAKVKVELPCRVVLRKVSIIIRQCNSDLNELEQLNITPHCLIMVVRRCFEGSNRSCYNTRELCVLLRSASDLLQPNTQLHEHTMATYGYLSMRLRIFRISTSRLFAHTSRIMLDYASSCLVNELLLVLNVLESAEESTYSGVSTPNPE